MGIALGVSDHKETDATAQAQGWALHRGSPEQKLPGTLLCTVDAKEEVPEGS